MISSRGTDKGKLSNVGSRTVKIGMDSSRFDGWCWNSVHASFVLSMIVRDVRKKVHSRRMLARLVILIPIPYHLRVAGHNSCTPPPVRKSPRMECWIMATKYGAPLFL